MCRIGKTYWRIKKQSVTIFKKYKIKSGEITFLSANTWDVSGGGNFGYNSIWVNRYNSVFDILDFQPKNEINNLTHLLDKV